MSGLNTRIWHRVTIVGCGLIGASFALALRQNNLCSEIAAWDTDQYALNRALELGIIDEIDHKVGDDNATHSDSDLYYLAMPVRGIIAFLKERSLRTKPGAVITDAGSTKRDICLTAASYVPNDRHFIAGHPLAGSHHSSLEYSRGDLFDNAVYLVIAGENEPESTALSMLTATLKRIGSDVQYLDVSEHDRRMAMISHLPQLISSALVASALEQLDPQQLPDLAGAGFRDMSRLAASPWSMWQDILLTNAGPIADALDIFISKLNDVRDELSFPSVNGERDLTHTSALFGLLESKS
jgi:prephenate dehydrogenase